MSSASYLFFLYTLLVTFAMGFILCGIYSVVNEWVYTVYSRKHRFLSSFGVSLKRVKTTFMQILGKQEKNKFIFLNFSDLFLIFSITSLLFGLILFPINQKLVKKISSYSQVVKKEHEFSMFFIISLLFASQVSQIFYCWIKNKNIEVLKVVNYSYEKISEMLLMFSIVLLMFVTYRTGSFVTIGQIQSESIWNMGFFTQPVAMLIFVTMMLSAGHKSGRIFTFELGSGHMSNTDDLAHEKFFTKIIHKLQQVVLILLFIHLFLRGSGAHFLSGGSTLDVLLGNLSFLFLKVVVVTGVIGALNLSLPIGLAEKVAQKRIKIMFPVVVVNIAITIGLFIL